jgi:putative endonuclease
VEDKHFNKLKGNRGEDIAAAYLERNGFVIKSRNFLCKLGECDIVAFKNETLHFVEVKCRTGDFIKGRFAVNRAKQKHIKGAAKYYLAVNGFGNKYYCCYDVCEITGGEIEFFENCFL